MAKKDQFIVVCADSEATAGRLLPTAHLFAKRLRKGIILLTCSPGGEEWVEKFDVPYMALKGDWKTAIDALPTVMNAVLALALADPAASRREFTHPRQLLKNFRDCKVAYLVLSPDSQVSTLEGRFSTALTIDHQRESKEKLIWASYMARFFGSSVYVMHKVYRDAAFKSRWSNNMRYLEKVFSSLGLSYETALLEGGSEFGNPDLAAIKKEGFELFIALIPDRRDRDLGDLFLKAAEQRLIENPRHLPILLLNQRDDLYVLCD